MLYDKSHFRKINDKKVLHKVKKHWVTLSLATLMLLGGTSIVSGITTHASQTGNHSSNQGSKMPLKDSGDNHGPQLVRGNQPTANHSNIENNDASEDQADVLANREHRDEASDLNARTRSPVKPQASNSAANLLSHDRLADDQGRTKQVSQPSVSSDQVSSAASREVLAERLYRDAQETWNHLGDDKAQRPHRLLGDTADDTEDGENDKLNQITNDVIGISQYANDAQANSATITSASNAAAAQLSRYDNVDSLTGVNSAQAEQDDSQINSEISAMPTKSLAIYSVEASVANDAVTDGLYHTDNPGDYNAIDSLYDKMNQAQTLASNAVTAVSNSVTDIQNQASDVSNVFSSVSAAANDSGSSTSDVYNQSYPVADVYTGDQFYEATFNPKIHQINLMNNVNLWDMPNSHGTANQYQEIPGRNLTVNGLTDNGTWNTIDAINYNFEMSNVNNADPGSGNTLKEDIKNLRMYGNSYWGVFSMNQNYYASSNSYQKFDNVDYVGSELTYNAASSVNSILAGKIRVNLGAYAPEGQDFHGNPITHYDYDSGGLSPIPYAGEKDDIENDPTARNNFHTFDVDNNGFSKNENGVVFPCTNAGFSDIDTSAGIDCSSDQQIIQADGVNVTFEPGCHFEGYTSNGDGIDTRNKGGGIANNGQGATIELDPDSYVHITPRGNAGETYNSGDGAASYLPNGIYLNGSSQLNIDNGASLKITPTNETDPYNESTSNDKYYPTAIYVNGAGTVDVKPGGSIDIRYPRYPYNKDGMLSLPTNNDAVTGSANGPLDIGGNATITVEDNANLIVNGGNPSMAAGEYKNFPKGNWSPAFLVAFNSANANGHINAKPNSVVKLSCGGSQPVVLFNSLGAHIVVDDPKLFQLDDSHNTNPDSQLAESGTGIEGKHVNVLDQNGTSYGQYNDVVFPGTKPDLVNMESSGTKTQIQNAVNAVFPEIDNWFNNNGDSDVLPYVDTQNNRNSIVNSVEQILPFAQTQLLDQSSRDLQHLFNHSIDLDATILNQMKNIINTNSAIKGTMTKDDVNNILNDLGDKTAAQDTLMSYAGKQVMIRPHGFDLQRGFAFKGVPDTFVEGISIKGQTVSGYAYPGSYIRFSKGEPGGSPVFVPGQTYDDHMDQGGNLAYDPADNDKYHMDYVTIADQKTGYWSYTVPKGIDPHTLDVVAHTQTVSPSDAARLVGSYVTGRQDVENSDTPDTADQYDSNPDNIYASGAVVNDDALDKNGAHLSGPSNYGIHDTNAGHDFQAGYIKGTHDKDDLYTDNDVYSEPDPFILGYELAQRQPLAIDDNNAMAFDRSIINGFIDYLPPVTSDSNAANSNSAAMTSTSADLHKAPVSSYSNLNSTRSDVNSDSISAQSFISDASGTSSEYKSVSDIDNQDSNDKTSFNGIYTDFTSAEQQYESNYDQASSAAYDGDSATEAAYLAQAHAYEADMNNDVNEAKSLASDTTKIDSSASNDNQSASSDSNSVSASAFSAQTEASNSIASAFSSSAKSYSIAVSSASSTATINEGLVSSKASALSYSAGVISSEYGSANAYARYFRQINVQFHHADHSNPLVAKDSAIVSGIVNSLDNNYNIVRDSRIAAYNSTLASSASQSASTSASYLPGFNISAGTLYNNVSASASAESVYNGMQHFDSASSENSLANVQISGINSSASVASSAVAQAWSASNDIGISSLSDDTQSMNMSEALSFASSAASVLSSDIDIDSGIASADRSAVNSASSDNSEAISDTPGASSAVSSYSVIISSANSEIASDMTNHTNLPNADSEAASAESAESAAESVITSAEGVNANRIVPITFVNSNGQQVGCSNESISGHVGGSVVSPLSSAAPAPSGYSYDGTAPTSYAFTEDNIDNTHAGYMKPVKVLVDGNPESLPIYFIDEDGHRVNNNPIYEPGTMGRSINLPSAPDDYTYDGAQPTTYTFEPANLSNTNSVLMDPYNIYVYDQRTFQFNVNAHKIVNGKDNGCVNTTSIPVTGKDGTEVEIKPDDYAPAGFTTDTSKDQPVWAKITKTGLEVLDQSKSHIIESNGTPISPDMNWDYDAKNSSNTQNPSDTEDPQPIVVTFKNAEDGSQIGDPHTVNGFMDQQIIVGDSNYLKLPQGYRIDDGAQTVYTISNQPQYVTVPLVPEQGESAVVNYVDNNTGDVVTQRAIDSPIGTKLSAIGSTYTDYVPYNYNFANKTSWDGKPDETVEPNSQYTVYVTRQNDRAQPVPNTDPNNGKITVNYQDSTGKLLSTDTTVRPDGTYFDSVDYQGGGNFIPTNYNYVNTVSGVPTKFIKGQNQTMNVEVTPNLPSGHLVHAKIEYVDVAKINDNGNGLYDGVLHNQQGTRVVQIPINGPEGQIINYNQYQQFIPQGYFYVGLSDHDDVLENDETDYILVKKAKPQRSLEPITINYLIENPNGQTSSYDSIVVDGAENAPFNLSYYEDDVPNEYTFDRTNNNPIEFKNVPQTVNLYIKPKKPAAPQYTSIMIHFVNASEISGLGSNPTKAQLDNIVRTDGYTDEVMTGHVGDLFNPVEYEHNTPQGTRYNQIVYGDDIAAFADHQQDVYIAVNHNN